MAEYHELRRTEGQTTSRWFSTADLDLILWEDDAGQTLGFQLCYDKRRIEHAITWRVGRGLIHEAVDSGESNPLKFKGSPILVPNGHFDIERIKALFDSELGELPAEIRDLVTNALDAYVASPLAAMMNDEDDDADER